MNEKLVEWDQSIAALIAEIRARVVKRQAPIQWTCQSCGKKTEQPRFCSMPGMMEIRCECGGEKFTTITISSDEPSADEDVLTLLDHLESAASALRGVRVTTQQDQGCHCPQCTEHGYTRVDGFPEGAHGDLPRRLDGDE